MNKSFEVNDKRNQSPLVNKIQVNLEKQIVEYGTICHMNVVTKTIQIHSEGENDVIDITQHLSTRFK